MEPPPQQPRQRIPKDGPGPRGLPDCYYTSRVLNSTFRYVKFVRKLRAEEEEQRRGEENKHKELKDKQISDFFIQCDRKSRINNVARRVDLCMKSYQEDLEKKRQRQVKEIEAIEIYKKEETENIRKFVVQAQAGVELIWQDKLKRLDYLLEKRRKEHEEKYKDTPLSKAAHVLPCIVRLRAKEAQEIQLYQMREKQSMKVAEKELDKMWYELAMKESDALAARMEQNAIECYRREMECKNYSDYQLEQKRIQREKDREHLKQKTLRMKAQLDEENRKEEEAERLRAEKRLQQAAERKQMIEDSHAIMAKREADDKLIGDTWDSLTGQGIAAEKAAIELRKRKEKELDICNKKMIELRDDFAAIDIANEVKIQEAAQQLQDSVDKRRCDYLLWSQKTNRDVRKAMIDQIHDRKEAREQLKQKLAEQDEYQRQLHEQLQMLVDHKAMTNAQERKDNQRKLLEQIEYNKLLKERARQEELLEIKKSKIAAREYQDEIKKMLCRPFFSDHVHPFMQEMSKGIKMRSKCPCAKPDYCK